VAYLRSEQPQKAEAAARAAVERLPEDVDVRINLASALLVQEQPEKAEAVLRKAIELDPSDPAPPLRLAELLVREGRGYDEVMELTTRATELDPGQGEADAIAALALRKQGRNEEAVRRLHTAAMAHPRNVRLWLMLAAIYRDMGEQEASARAAGMAFRFAPRRRMRTGGDLAPETGATDAPAEEAPAPGAGSPSADG
jgi:Flp pilus assembly protein TadD